MLRLLALAVLLIPFHVSHGADEPAPSFPTPPRISLLDGQVSFQANVANQAGITTTARTPF